MIAGTRYRLDQQAALQKRLSQGIARDLSDLSTQKRLTGPSDDPAAAARIAQIERAQSDETGWAANAAAATSLSDRVDTSLSTLQTSIDRAKTLMLQASSATTNASDRASIAIELRGIAEDVAALAQQKDSRGQPLFADGPALSYPVGAGINIQAGSSRTGIFEALSVAGGPKDLSAILADAAAAIETGDDVVTDPVTGTTDRATATAASLAELDTAAGSVADARTEQGVRAARLDRVADRLAATKLTNSAERSGLEDTDVDDTVIRMQARMTALKAAQAALAKAVESNLFDYIR